MMMLRFAVPMVGVMALGAAVAFAAPPKGAGDAAAGQTTFKARCAMCHVGPGGGPSMLAPNLKGVGGRKAASTGFAYSDALKKSGLSWSRPNLDKFLTAPQQMVPGTRMVISVPDAKQRADVVAFLSSYK